MRAYTVVSSTIPIYPKSADWYDGIPVILSQRAVMSARMSIAVGLNVRFGSTPILASASL